MNDEDLNQKFSKLEGEFTDVLQKLVNNNQKFTIRINLDYIADIFNAVSERLEKATQENLQERQLLYLNALSMFVGNNPQQQRVDNTKILTDIIASGDNILLDIIAIKLQIILSGKKSLELASKIANIAQAYNLLISKDKRLTLWQLVQKQYDKESLAFEIDQVSSGLNEKSQQVTIFIPAAEILNSQLKSLELAKDIATKNGQDNESFIQKLSVKIQWFRLQDKVDGPKLLITAMDAIYVACTVSIESRQQEFASFLKDQFIYQCIEVLQNTMHTDVAISILSTITYMIQKPRQDATQIEQLIKPMINSPQQNQEEDRQPIISKIIEDLASVKFIQDEFSNIQLERHEQKLIGQHLVSNNKIQYQLMSLALICLKHMQNQHRGTVHYNDMANSIIGSLMKIIQDEPVNQLYNFNPAVGNLAAQILKIVVRPRAEESNDIISRFEKRIAFEVQNIDKEFYYWNEDEKQRTVVDQKERQYIIRFLIIILTDLMARDQQGLGMGRKIMESQIVPTLHTSLKLNTEEKGQYIDEFVTKYLMLLGSICGDNPAQTSTLIKNDIIPQVLSSFEQRLPQNYDIFDQVVYGLNQLSIQEEGQQAVLASNLFKILLEKAIDKKFSTYLNLEQPFFKVHLGNLFDRNNQFKDVAKEMVRVYLNKIKNWAQEKATQFIQNFRRTDLSIEQKIIESQKGTQPSQNIDIIGALQMIYNFSFLSNDHMAHNRHSQEIMESSVFEQCLEVFQSVLIIPSLQEYQPYFEKFMKVLIENTVYPVYVIKFIDKLKTQTEKFQNIIGVPIYQLDDFNFEQQEEGRVIKPIEELNTDNLSDYLTKGEQILFQLTNFQQLVKLTHYLHTQTFHGVIQSPVLIKVAKTVFYIQRIIQKQKANYFIQQIELQQQNQESEEYKQYGQHLFKLYNSEEGNSLQEKRERMTMIRNYLYQEMNKSFQANKFLKMKEKFFSDFLTKFSQKSFQVRTPQQKEALDKNLMFIGKLVYKITKQLQKQKLDSSDAVADSKVLLKKLFQMTQSLLELQAMVQQGMVDGVSFYTFVKKGGINNLIECFEQLASVLHKIDGNFQSVYVFLFDEACTTLKQVMTNLFNGRNNDTNINSILNANFGNDYENAKNLYQSFYTQVSAKLLHLQDQQQENLILKLQHQRSPYLQDIVMNFLRNASKSFANCPLLKEGLRQERDNGRRQQRNQADPMQVEMIISMGFNFNRDRVNQALLQTHNNIDNAVNLLLEWQAQEQLGIEENLAQVDEGFSSGESDNEGSSAMLNLDNAQQLPVIVKEKKVPQVSQEVFQETLKKVQQLGFQWIVECLANQTSENQIINFREYIVTQMINEKTEATQKQMYSEIDKIFKQNLANIFQHIQGLNKENNAQGEDQIMEDINTVTNEKKYEQLSKDIQSLQNDINLILKLINTNKNYLKEAILKSDVFIKIVDLISRLVLHFNQQFLKPFLETDYNNNVYQRLIHDAQYFCFTVSQLSQMQVNIYQSSKEQVDVCKKKAAQYQQKVPLDELLKIQMKILSYYQEQQQDEKKIKFKKAIMSTAAALSLKILIGNQYLSNLDQQTVLDKSLGLFNSLNSIQGSKSSDSQIQNSTLILQLEDQKLLQSQIEKLSLRVLYLKYEHETKGIENSKSIEVTSYQKSKSGFNNFLKYFSILQQRDTNTFKQIMNDNFEVQTVKKLNSLSQDQATIHIKESKFIEVRKQIVKERSQLKQLVKSFDFKNDKHIKSIITASKKQLITTLNENFQKSIQSIIQCVSQKTSTFLEEFSQFNQQQQNNQKLIVNKVDSKDVISQLGFSRLDTLCQLSLAYPAVTIPLLQSHPQPKRSFSNWYIKDYIVSQMLNKTTKLIPQQPRKPDDMDMTQPEQTWEVNFVLKKTLTTISSQVFLQLNNLTSYNHLMTLHEQAVKHQLRTKFMLEALHVLQRALKDKNQNQTLQKCLILSSLIVIESLINFQDDNLVKHEVLAQDNFANSIRVAVQRDAANKESQLPPSLVKLLDELVGEVIDVTLESNSQIVSKVVSILNVLAEFINNEKKKEEKKIKEVKKPLQNKPSSIEEEKKDVHHSEQVRQEASADNQNILPVAQLHQFHSDNINNRARNLQDDDLEGDDDEDDEGIMMEDDVDMYAGNQIGVDEDDEDEDDDDQDEEDEDDDGEDGDDMEDADGDEEDIYDDDEELPDAIVIGRNNAIFEVDDDEDDDGLDEDGESIIFEENRGGWALAAAQGAGNRQQQQLDIINPVAADQLEQARIGRNQFIRFHDVNVVDNRRSVAGANGWSEEEAQVQRILTQMRAQHHHHPHAEVHQPRVHANDLLFGNVYRQPYNRDPMNAVPQVPALKATSMIDQMYEGLKPISEKDFLEMVTKHRQLLEEEIQEEQKLNAQPAEKEALESLVNARLEINRISRRLEDMSDGDFMEAQLNHEIGGRDNAAMLLNQIMRQERDLMGLMHPPGLGLGGIANPLLDPLFMRPPHMGLDINGLHIGNNLFGGPGLAPPEPARVPNIGQDNILFNYFTRNQAQVQTNLNDDLGQQLLTTMMVHAEEEKVPEQPQRVQTQESRQPTEEAANLTNDQLLLSFFAGSQAPQSNNAGAGGMMASSVSPNLIPPFDLGIGQAQPNAQQQDAQQVSSPRLVNAAGNEVINERLNIDERSRELREQIQRDQQDIQNIISMSSSNNQVDVQMQDDNQQQQQQIQIQPVQDQINQINISDDINSQLQNQDHQMVANQQQQQQLPANDDDDISAFDDQPRQQPPIVEEEKKQEEPQPSSNNADDNTTFGYDNELLISHGIDPFILIELPEELRAELLSTIDIPPPQVNAQQQQQQPPAENQQQQQQPGQEEQKQDQQPPSQQQQNSNPVNDIANELGLDPEFLANLPEDMQLELIQNEQLRRGNLGQQQQQQVPQREPEQMDLASFVATVVDPALRREIFSNMDEATVASLPPNLMAEARRVHEQLRNERHRYRDNFENMDRRARGFLEQMDPRYNMGGAELGGYRGRIGEEQKQQPQIGGKPLEEVVILRHQQLFEEMSNEDFTQLLITQMTYDEKILEQLLLVLIANQSVQCSLIPCITNLIKVHSNGLPVIRNKVLNAITFLLKSIATNDEEAFKAIYPNSEIKKKQSALILIGCLRLLLKSNKSLMKHILKGLFSKEDKQLNASATKTTTNHVLKKQQKYMNSKIKVAEQQIEGSDSKMQDEQQINTSTSKITIVNAQVLPALAEIFYLIRTDMFKTDKSLLKNLSMLIHQILKELANTIEDQEQLNSTISSDTIQSIAEVLSLDIIDSSLMESLGEFLFQISKKKKENFDLISQYCHEKANLLVDSLSQRLNQVLHSFNDMKSRVSPGKIQLIENYSPSHFGGDSIYEEEKSEMMIDTNLPQSSQDLQRQASSTAEARNMSLKLQDEDEKHIKSLLKMSDQSEMLLRILKLFNLFYEKFSTDIKVMQEDQEMPAEENKTDQFMKMTEYIHDIFKTDKMSYFVKMVSNVMRVAFKTNIEAYENLSILLFCVFCQFFPDMVQSMRDEEEQAKLQKLQPDSTGNQQQKSKYQIKMMSFDESQKRQNKLIIFRNQNFFNNRVQEFSAFCYANKRLINKLIKSKPAYFTGELEGLVKYMPNLLDFDNKRAFFKRELTKLKKSQAYHSIQLFIRRDDIFMDSYAQISIRQADEMKGRLQVQFTGERGQDAGGLTRDFFTELSRQMFNPNYSLFVLSSSGSTYYPNPKSYIQADHLRYFKFIGRVVGKALYEECMLECYFVKSFYKIITGEPLMISDLEDFDNEFYNNVKWCLENDITALQTTFVVEEDYFGKKQDFDLIENGSNIPVTNDNKNLYIEKLVHFQLYKRIQQQVDAFLEGFYEMIPKDLINVFTHKELELLISGLPNFDLNDLKQNTEYLGYNAQSPQVLWMWEIFETFDSEDRAQFLQFVTGSSKVPIDGFKGLMGMRGPQKFTIAKIKTDDILRLPSGHTCFNQIDIPEYPSKEIMHERVLTAIKETKGFGFA